VIKSETQKSPSKLRKAKSKKPSMKDNSIERALKDLEDRER